MRLKVFYAFLLMGVTASTTWAQQPRYVGQPSAPGWQQRTVKQSAYAAPYAAPAPTPAAGPAQPDIAPGSVEDVPSDFGAAPGYPADDFDNRALGNCGRGMCDVMCAPRFYVELESLNWWGKAERLPPLVTTSVPGTTQNNAGVLGLSSTSILYGDQLVQGGERSGGRFTFGYWMDPCQTNGLDFTFFGLDKQTTHFGVESFGDPILARPFFNVSIDAQAAQLVAFPGIAVGRVQVSTSNESLGTEILLRHAMARGCGPQVDALIGYRFVRLDEDLSIHDQLISIDSGSQVPVGTVVGGTDSFSTINEFSGCDFGLNVVYRRCKWSLEMVGKVALGDMHQRTEITGSTFVAEPTQPISTRTGGLLAQPTNIGTYERNVFEIVPEVGLTLGYDVTCRLRLSLGYSFIYFTSVARPADQIDTSVNPTQISGPLVGVARPAFHFVGNDYWLQGLNLGLQYRF